MRVNYPNLIFNRACLVDGNILIQDIEPELPIDFPIEKLNSQIRELNRVSNSTLQLVDGMKLTRNLLKTLEPNIDQFRESLVVYPGNGARMVYGYLCLAYNGMGYQSRKKWNFLVENAVFAQTTRRGRTDSIKDEASVEINFEGPLPKAPKTVLVIDDVVASGLTAQSTLFAIKNRLRRNRIKFYFATWLLVKPPNNPRSYLERARSKFDNYGSTLPWYETVFADMAVKGNMVRRPPINSLSCFLDETGRYDTIKDDYIKRYLPEGEEYFNKLKGLVGKGGKYE